MIADFIPDDEHVESLTEWIERRVAVELGDVSSLRKRLMHLAHAAGWPVHPATSGGGLP